MIYSRNFIYNISILFTKKYFDSTHTHTHRQTDRQTDKQRDAYYTKDTRHTDRKQRKNSVFSNIFFQKIT